MSPTSSGAIVDLIADGTISGKIAKDLFEIVWTEGGDPKEIVEARGMKQVTDTGAIETAVDAIIAANPDKVEQVEGEADAARMVRRPGDEGDRRQGESAGGERAAQTQVGRLTQVRSSKKTNQFATRAARFLSQQRRRAPFFFDPTALTTNFFFPPTRAVADAAVAREVGAAPRRPSPCGRRVARPIKARSAIFHRVTI